MRNESPSVEARLAALETSVRRSRAVALAAGALLLALAAGGRGAQGEVVDSVRARRFAVVDDAGVERLVMGQDPKDTQRRSRSCGLTLHDATGVERGGFSTFDDLSVVLALDAPRGVGDPMRDRVALDVQPDGAGHVMLIDNRTLVPVRLASDAAGGGGLELIGYDFEKKLVTIKRLAFAGETRSELPLGERK